MAHLITLQTCQDVDAALNNAALVPPAAPATLAPGSTLDLRNAMARFSSEEVHALRRAAVIKAIGSIDPRLAEATASLRTHARLQEGEVDGFKDIALCVPTETMADLLGFGHMAEEMRKDVLTIVEVIGRGSPSSEPSDEAVDRLIA